MTAVLRSVVLGLALLAGPAVATAQLCPFATTFVVGDCSWCGVNAARKSTVTYYWQPRGYFCSVSSRRYSWYPCYLFNPPACTVDKIQAGNARQCQSAIGNHVIRDTSNANSDRIRRIERRMYACLTGHDL